MKEFTPPSRAAVWAMTAPARAYFRPRYFGLERIRPHGKTLFVGNHTIYGLFDAPLLFAKVYKETGLAVRSLGDKAHFQVPGWREFLARLGTVNATRENTAALMRAGEPVLVFPGGGREVMKRKGEAYRLIWKKRIGFVRLAVAHGYDIQPFASVGAEEVYDIIADANDFAASKLGRLLLATPLGMELLRGGDMVPPIVRGRAGPIPKRARFYFSFGAPIPTGKYRGRHEDDEAMFELRAKVERALLSEIAAMQAERAHDAGAQRGGYPPDRKTTVKRSAVKK